RSTASAIANCAALETIKYCWYIRSKFPFRSESSGYKNKVKFSSIFVLSKVIVPSSIMSLDTVSKSNKRRRFLFSFPKPNTSISYNEEVNVNLPNGTSKEIFDLVNQVGSANHSSG